MIQLIDFIWKSKKYEQIINIFIIITFANCAFNLVYFTFYFANPLNNLKPGLNLLWSNNKNFIFGLIKFWSNLKMITETHDIYCCFALHITPLLVLFFFWLIQPVTDFIKSPSSLLVSQPAPAMRVLQSWSAFDI